MFGMPVAVNHIAIALPGRDARVSNSSAGSITA
jgi:hypothetical protein